MKKAAFVCSSEQNIKRVFSENEVNRIKEHVQLLPQVFNKKSIAANAGELADCEIIFSTWDMERFSEEEIKKYFPKLKYLFYAAGSVQSFAKEFINSGVKVFSAWMANAVPVAEFTFAQIMLANKGYFAAQKNTKYMRGKAARRFAKHGGNYGSVVGIVGAGAIGSMVCQRLKGTECRVLCCDPFLPQERASELGVELVTIEELFKNADVISNHLADKKELENFYNYKLFSLMKPYSTFINTGRGRQVDNKALCKALKKDKTRTALLDVTYPEVLPLYSGLLHCSNAYITPHMAGSSGKEVERMAAYMADEMERIINGSEPLYEVSKKMLETMA